MATVKKTAGTTAKKKKPAMGSAAVARPEAKPFPGTAKKGKKAPKSVIMQVDPFWQNVAVGIVLLSAVYVDQLRRNKSTSY